MKNLIFVIALLLCAPAISMSASQFPSGDEQKVVIRSTVRLYFQNEVITLYPNGNCLLSIGDSQAIEAKYAIRDEGNWIYFYITTNSGNTETVTARCSMRGGTVYRITFNGNVYIAR